MPVGAGSLQTTASAGAAALADASPDGLISAADKVLYVATGEGENRTVKAEPETANGLGQR